MNSRDRPTRLRYAHHMGILRTLKDRFTKSDNEPQDDVRGRLGEAADKMSPMRFGKVNYGEAKGDSPSNIDRLVAATNDARNLHMSDRAQEQVMGDAARNYRSS